MLSIIDRYILREVTKSFFGILIVLLVIVVGNGFSKFLQKAAAGLLSSDVVMELISLETIRVLGLVIAPTYFLAILYTLGRMYRDNEITALSTSGVGTLRIYRSFILAALPVSLVVAYLTLIAQPWVNNMKEEIILSQKQQVAELGAAVAGRFNEFSRGDLVFYVESLDEQSDRMQNIFVQNRQHGRLGLITSTEGYQYIDPDSGDHYLVLTDGYRYEGLPGNNEYVLGQFEKYVVRVEDETDSASQPVKARSKPSLVLMNSASLHERTEFQYRLIFPVAVLVFTLVSIPLSKSLPREGIYGRLLLAILIYFIFMNLQAVSGNWMSSGVTPEWMGRWWIHPVMLVFAGGVIYIRSPRVSRWFSRRIGRLSRKG
ncbi:MAG: LPS export ABC transporter permease LptF [Gammaproteobacteria bacterium]|nr:LPS export ABC transporter permease LptF [Gammaproteobacteria bacterium]